MPKLIVSIDGVVIKEVQLTKDRTTLGRRPYNDIVIDNLAISGEHALFQVTGKQVYLEDLNSTNGSDVNGKVVKKQLLQNGDAIEVGKYQIKFVDLSANEATGTIAPPISAAGATTPAALAGQASSSTPPVPVERHAAIKVLSGIAAGREVALTKVVTTLGKPGVAIAAITRQNDGFVIHHVEGAQTPTLNGELLSAVPLTLKDGDLIELAGTQMQFSAG